MCSSDLWLNWVCIYFPDEEVNLEVMVMCTVQHISLLSLNEQYITQYIISMSCNTLWSQTLGKSFVGNNLEKVFVVVYCHCQLFSNDPWNNVFFYTCDKSTCCINLNVFPFASTPLRFLLSVLPAECSTLLNVICVYNWMITFLF